MASGGRLALVAALSCAGAVEVDELDEEIARVVDARGRAHVVPRRSLPEQAKEGAVVRCGRVDPVETLRRKDEVRALQAASGRKVVGRLDLSMGPVDLER
jgi:hypothetical protein